MHASKQAPGSNLKLAGGMAMTRHLHVLEAKPEVLGQRGLGVCAWRAWMAVVAALGLGSACSWIGVTPPSPPGEPYAPSTPSPPNPTLPPTLPSPHPSLPLPP